MPSQSIDSFAEVIVKNSHIDILDYQIPENLLPIINLGAFVVVPFGVEFRIGIVWKLKATTDLTSYKSIKKIVEDIPSLDDKTLSFLRWISEYYLCSLSKTVFSAIPFASGKYIKFRYELDETHRIWSELSEFEKNQLREFISGQTSNSTKLPNDFRLFAKMGLIRKMPNIDFIKKLISKNDEKNAKLNELSVANLSDPIKSEISKIASNKEEEQGKATGDDSAHDVVKTSTELQLTQEQQIVLDTVSPAVNQGGFQRFLLHGVTGSGKTEIYLCATNLCLQQKKSVLFLVPEIALAPQNFIQLENRFPGQVFVKHSGKKPNELVIDWFGINNDEPKILVGTRSAIFSPIRQLGLIIVDEEHDNSYKQQELEPYYSAKDSAVNLAKIFDCPIILGSATPSIESYHNAKTNKYRLLRMNQRINKANLPEISISNPKDDPSSHGIYYLSSKVEQMLREAYEQGKQSLLFVNRRGFASFIHCQACRNPVYCVNCSIPYTLSKKKKSLVCHHCGKQAPVPDQCPTCGQEQLRQFGFGTERIEQDIRLSFPDAEVLRIDSETMNTAKKWEEARKKIDNNEVQFIVGTQMITKGHDFRNIALVCALYPEMGLNYPDFRSSERVFQLLVQVSGRAGRGGDLPGKTLIQHFQSLNPVIQLATENKYEEFYDQEMIKREILEFPPFSKLALIVYSDTEEVRTYNAVLELHKILSLENRKFEGKIMGPVESPLYKISNSFYWQWLISTKSHKNLRDLGKRIQDISLSTKLKGKLKFIIDPLQL